MNGELQALLSTFVTNWLVISNLAGKLLELNVGHVLKQICEELKKHDLELDCKKLEDHKSGSGSDHLDTPCTTHVR